MEGQKKEREKGRRVHMYKAAPFSNLWLILNVCKFTELAGRIHFHRFTSGKAKDVLSLLCTFPSMSSIAHHAAVQSNMMPPVKQSLRQRQNLGIQHHPCLKAPALCSCISVSIPSTIQFSDRAKWPLPHQTDSSRNLMFSQALLFTILNLNEGKAAS